MNIRHRKSALVLPLVLAGFLLNTPGLGQANAQVDDDAIFDQLDTDGDGFVSQGEFDALKIRVVEQFDHDRNNGLDIEELQISQGAFDEIDRDGDGLVSPLEFVISRFGSFDTRDLNNDGKISREEFHATEQTFRE